MSSDSRPSLTDAQRQWLAHLEACGDGSMKAYAEANDLDLQKLYQAKATLKRRGLLRGERPRLLRVERSPMATPIGCRVQLPNGAIVEFACPPEHWGSLLESIAALP